MADDPKPDLDVECDVVSEYGLAMATAAESLLRYHGRMQAARSEDERTFIRKSHAELLRRTIDSHRIAFAAMIQKPINERVSKMKWFYRGMMAASVIGGALVSGGILPLVWGGVFVATGTAAGFFHESPNQASK